MPHPSYGLDQLPVHEAHGGPIRNPYTGEGENQWEIDPADASGRRGRPTDRNLMTFKRRAALFSSIRDSYRRLEPHRKLTTDLVQEYAGPMYSLDNPNGYPYSNRQEKYLPMLKQAASAYMTLLASNNPRVLVTSPRLEYSAFAKHFEHALNRLVCDIELSKTLSRWVLDAFFWVGFVKCHMKDTGELKAVGDLRMDPGKPFVSNVHLDDMFWDTNARSWNECQYIGDIYQLPVDYLQNSGIYKGKVLKELPQYQANREEETQWETKDLSRNYEPRVDYLEDLAYVCDVWIPADGTIYTFVVEQKVTEINLKGEPIASMKWEGARLGPYHVLHFDEVPENVMPCSVAADLYPLDRLVNNLYRKNSRKARRQKDTPVFEPSGKDTASKLQRASDGEWVGVTNPKDVAVIKHGGIDPNLHGFMLNGMELFDRMAGNLQAMLGLGAQSDTVGQEKLIHGAASRREGQLQTSMMDATNKLMHNIAYMLWQDDFTEIPQRIPLEGVDGVSYDATWSPDYREGRFKDYNLEVDIYSMQYQGPGARANQINTLLSTMYVPMMPMIQAQGGMIDFAKLVELHADLLNLPRLKEIVMFSNPTGEAGLETPPKSPMTERNYTRRNVSGNDNNAVPDASSWMQGGQASTNESL